MEYHFRNARFHVKCQNLQMSLTFLRYLLRFQRYTNFKFATFQKSRSRSWSTIFAVTQFDSKYAKSSDLFNTFLH